MSGFAALIAWMDRGYEDRGEVILSRVRSQYANAVLMVFVSVPYILAFIWLNVPVFVGVLGLVNLAVLASLVWGTRRGHYRWGGVVGSVGYYVTVACAIVSRGGVFTSGVAWLMLAPVLGLLLVGPRHGMAMGGLVGLTGLGLWGWETVGLPLPSGFPPDFDHMLTAFDVPVVALSVALMLFVQAIVWDRASAELRRLNDEQGELNRSLESEISERKTAIAQAESAAKARSTFLATMSHEIRTPLNGVLGLADVLLDGETDPERVVLLDTIVQSGDLLKTLLDDVLDYSKIDSGALEIESIAVKLEYLGQGVLRLWEPRAIERGLDLRMDTDPLLPYAAVLDPTRLKQILGNLLSNAIKFTHEGQVRLSIGERQGQLAIAVSDTGIGMSAEALDKIFQPFQQADSGTTRRFGGTGLGLTISRELAEAMGGRLEVRSEVGVGSTFTVLLPLVEATDAAEATIPPELGGLHGKRILVAEDNPVNQLVITKLLERLGIEAEVVPDGRACVERWPQSGAELILMDCQMPVCDGYEATRALREQGVQAPIIAVTATILPGDRTRCLEAGMDDFIAKPVRAEQLARVLDRWM